MAYKLGKKPARKGAIAFRLTDFFDLSKLPTPPEKIGFWNIGRPWEMYANDQYGCCVWAGAAHEHMMWAACGERPRVDFTDANVLADYATVAGFDPKNPDTDEGTDMGAAAAYRRKTGIVDAKGNRHTVDAYVSLKPGNPDHLAIATYLTGAVGVGLMLPGSAMEQFDAEKPWQPVAKSGGPAGGHYVSCIGRNSVGDFLVVTWGRIHAMSPKFYATYNDESVAFLGLDALRNKVSRAGFDEDTLRRHLKLLDAKEASQ